MEHFTRNSSTLVAPIGTSALDKNAARTKARSRARTCMPNKPDKYGVRFYTVVSTTNCYVSNINDNCAGNETGYMGAADFCRVFGDMRTPYRNGVEGANSRIEGSSPSALWLLQMALQTKRLWDPSRQRVFFTDNFYTRHNLAMSLREITDGKALMFPHPSSHTICL